MKLLLSSLCNLYAFSEEVQLWKYPFLLKTLF